MYKIIVKHSNQILTEDIKTLKQAKDTIKNYTENHDLYKKEELKIMKG